MVDPYKILGLEPGASKEEISKAYKKLALEWHPDRHQGDKQAEEKFKEINGAYQLLKDGNYDPNSFNGNFDGFNIQDIFDQAFGSFGAFYDHFDSQYGFGKQNQIKYRGEIQVSLEEAHLGCSKKLSIQEETVCTKCKGSGVTVCIDFCTHCHGSGSIRQKFTGAFVLSSTCGHCKGTGHKIEGVCGVCSGRGKIAKTEEVVAIIPSGVKNGQVIRIRQDLEVVISYAPHAEFKFKGLDIISKFEVNMFDILLGASVEVKTISGTRTLKINPGTQPNSTLRIKNGGIGGKGDHLIEIKLTIPKNLTENQIEILKQLKETFKEE